MNSLAHLLLAAVLVVSLTTGVYHKTQQAQIQYAHARQLSAKGDFAHAIIFYEKSLAYNPKDAKVLKDAATCYQSLSRFSDASILLKEILVLNPQDDDTRLFLARTLSWQKSYPASIEVYKELLTRDNELKLKKELADVYRWDKQYDEAHTLLKQMLHDHPDDMELKWRMAVLLHDSGKIDEEGYEGLLKQNEGEHKQVKEYLAEFYMHKGEHDQALAYYEDILKSDSKNQKAKESIADILSWQKKYPEAISLYKELLLQNPNQLAIQEKLADVYVWNKQYDEAQLLLKQMLHDHPDDMELKWRMAVLLHDSGKIDEEGYEGLLKQNEGEHKQVKEYLAEFYMHKGEHDQALAYYEDILKSDSKNQKAKESIADILSWQKKYPEAISLYKELLVQNPNQLAIQEKLADVYVWNKQYDEAQLLLKQMLHDHPDDMELKWRMAVLLHDSGKIDEEGYEGLLKQCERQKSQAKEYLAEFYIHKGEYDQAMAYYEDILKSSPENKKAKISIADILSWQKKYPEAISLYKELLLQNPNQLEIQKKLAAVYVWNKQYDEAQLLLKQMLHDYPGDLELKWRMAILLHDSGKIDEEGYEGILKQSEGEHKEVKEYLAEFYMHKGEHDQAMAYYEDILKSDPENQKARISIADILSWQKKYPEAISLYIDAYRGLLKKSNTLDLRKKLAQVYVWNKQYDEAYVLLKQMLHDYPGDLELKWRMAVLLHDSGRVDEEGYEALLKETEGQENQAKEYLAELYIHKGEYDPAIVIYQNELKESGNDPVILEKLADIYMWKKEYKKSLALYDAILMQKEIKRIRLKKARIYGWIKQYSLSMREYEKILTYDADPLVVLERNAKISYWNNQIIGSISSYEKLEKLDPQNLEAPYDLSQIYAWHSMWTQAQEQFEKILKALPDDPLAAQGLTEVELLSKEVSLSSGYEFFDAHSQSRDTDIHRNGWENDLSIPVNDHLIAGIDETDTWRSFKDFSSLSEQSTKLSLSYMDEPDWWTQGFYQLYTYGRGIDALSTFGMGLGNRIDGAAVSNLSFERVRLDNTSSVIRNNEYDDQIKERLDFDVSSRLKAGLDYQFSNYSDGNHSNQPGGDIRYFLSLDPDRVSVEYRLAYTDFNHMVNAYFSPQDFYANTWGINWRHYFNKDGVFFGSDDIYSEIGYEVTLDSLNTTTNHYYGELNWDINKRLQLKLQGSLTSCNPNVYQDKSATVSAKYHF